MQLTGSLFANMSAIYGNSLSTFPDYPAEIRAPHGTVSGVSGFQVHIGSEEVSTPGDYCDLLVAMNPAALKANAKWCKRHAMILFDSDAFDAEGISKAGFETDNPFAELKVDDRTLIAAPISTLTQESLKDSGLDVKSMLKCKNMFTLGMACYIYNRPLEQIFVYLEKKFEKKHTEMLAPNKKVLMDGHNYAANIQVIPNTYTVELARPDPPQIAPSSGEYTTAMDTSIYVIVPEGCTAYYAFDERPTVNSTEYTGPVSMKAGTHIFYAIIQDENGKVSAAASATYTLTEAE